MQIQREQPQLLRPQSVPREEVLVVVLLLQISSFHQRQEKHLRRLSAIMVVQLGLSWLQDDILLMMRVSLRGSHSSRHRL